MIMEETYEMFEFDQKMERMMKLGYLYPFLELELKREDFIIFYPIIRGPEFCDSEIESHDCFYHRDRIPIRKDRASKIRDLSYDFIICFYHRASKIRKTHLTRFPPRSTCRLFCGMEGYYVTVKYLAYNYVIYTQLYL